MKRLTLFVVLALVLALAVPVMAGPFSDVPPSHWAYDALNKLVAAGLLTGYPDGTFRGKETMTRYEISLQLARVLDLIAEERALLSENMDALENGLSAGQAEDVIAIYKSLMAKNKPAEVKIPESLTANQAEEVAGIVEAMAMEFQFELESLGADLDALKDQMTALEVISWNGSYDVVVDRHELTGNGTPFFDPFNKNYDGDQGYEELAKADGTLYASKTYDEWYDYYGATDDFYHELTLGMDVAGEGYDANFDVQLVNDDFFGAASLDVADFAGTITGDNFKAVVDRKQKVTLAPYVLGNPYTKYHGINTTIGDDQYVLFNYDTVVLAGKHALGLLDSTMYFGLENPVYGKKVVAGLNIPYSVAGVDLNLDAAVDNNTNDAPAKYVTVNAATAVGPVSLEGNYTLKDDAFSGINADGVKSAGYDVAADATLLDGAVKLNGHYADTSKTVYGFGGEAALVGVEASFDQEFVSTSIGDVNRTKINVDYAIDIAFLNVATGYTYNQYEDYTPDDPVNPTRYYASDKDGNGYKESPDSQFNGVNVDVTADLAQFLPGLSANAAYNYGISNHAYGDGLNTHSYGVDYEVGIIAAGFGYDVASGMTANLTVNPEAYEIVGFGIDTQAGVGFENYGNNVFDYNVGVDVTKAMGDKADFTYSYLYDNREIGAGSNVVNGELVKQTVTFGYDVTADLNAEANYTNMIFTGVDAADSYAVQELTAGLGFSF